jgi:argininosuccinate lyase
MKTPEVLFIESNTSGTGRIFARMARECGYRPVVFAESPSRYSFLQQDEVECVTCETSSLPRLMDAVGERSREARVAGIFSSSEYFIHTAAQLAQEYGLPAPDAEALQQCRNKWRQRTLLHNAGFHAPKFQLAHSMEEAQAALDKVPLPVVLKPLFGSGSFGVRLCKTRAEVAEHGNFLLHRTENERGIPTPPEFLVEEYMVGPEFSVEGFNGKAVGITRKHVSGEPFFVELGHDFPAVLPPETAAHIVEVTEATLKEMRLTWGPVHVELRLTEKGAAIIEINPRLAGGFIPEIVRLACGVDLVKATLMLAAGECPRLSVDKRRFASIRFVAASQNGRVQHIIGVDEARKIPGVFAVEMYVNSGDPVTVLHDFRDRLGHVIACGDVASQVMNSADAALRRISVQMETPTE